MSDTPISESEFERIESFLLNKLSQKEEQEFRKELASDATLAAKTETVKLQIDAVNELARKEYLESVHPTEKDNLRPINSPFTKLKSLSVAASVAVLIGIAAIYVLSQNSTDDLYVAHFKPDEGLITPMGSSKNYEFFRGMVDYKQGKYDEAIARWKKELTEKRENDTLNYFIGVSLMAQNQTKEAIPFLKVAEGHEKGVFYQDVLYYRALAELKEGNVKLAKEFLAKSSSPKAKKLLTSLNKE